MDAKYIFFRAKMQEPRGKMAGAAGLTAEGAEERSGFGEREMNSGVKVL